jgi:DNA modification methylase
MFSYKTNTFYCGDALTVLRTLPSNFVHTVVTSPPYYNLRNYSGVSSQLGLEDTPEDYVNRLVAIFHEARRVLRDDGVLWLNLGDSYAANRTKQVSPTKWAILQQGQASHVPLGLKPKDLIGIPWRVAFALQDDGWYLRSDIIWSKPNALPESVRDRPTKAHEYMFLLSKNARYFYDADAILEPCITKPNLRKKAFLNPVGKGTRERNNSKGKNKRSVWTIASKPSPLPHFAMFPPALIEPCILAGSSSKCCAVCGAPYKRQVQRESSQVNLSEGLRQQERANGARTGGIEHVTLGKTEQVTRTTLGFVPTCTCNADTKPCVILDPFMGMGTTALVALQHGREYVGIDIDPKSVKWAEKRIQYKGNDRQLMRDERNSCSS